MHYVPKSAGEFFQEPESSSDDDDGALAAVAPLYALTTLVGLLLAVDALLGAVTIPGWEWLRSPGGYRLALLAAVLGGSRILYHSLENVLAGKFGADLALTTACLAAIALGEHQTAGLVVFISLVGEAVEGFTLLQARGAIRRTFEQRPTTAHLLRDGLEREIPAADLQPGDEAVVRGGERFPADGRILRGSTAVNESLLTGESRPIEKSIHDTVFGGSTNVEAAVTITVESVGANSVAAEIERLVRQASSRKMACERLADRFARWFLPAVLMLAAATLCYWRLRTGSWQSGWSPALGVLVVACPCALVLATPCAVMAALSWLARHGIVVKGSGALERLSTVDYFAFDKTGTISEGDLSLGDVLLLTEISPDELLRLATSAERPSNHTVARILRQEARRRGLASEWPEAFAGNQGPGIVARMAANSAAPGQTREVMIGSARFLSEREITISDDGQAAAAKLLADGQSPLFVAIDGRLAGIIGLRETLRPESQSVLRALKREGIQGFALLTGDRHSPTETVSRALGGFDHVAAEQRPDEKARWIESLRRAGRRVAMIGDGVNDAPALAAADVGLAVCRSGNELAGEAGDILLLRDPLGALPGLLQLSRALVENIRQSLWLFALGINGFGVIACMSGWLNPVGAAVFHEAASLLVLLNALRLLWFRTRPTVPEAVTAGASNSPVKSWAADFSPGRILVRMFREWRMAGQLLVCLLFAGWLCSQWLIVREGDSVIVLRGGKFQEILSPGCHWRWPYPLERLIRLRPDSWQTVTVGLRAGPAADATIAGERAEDWEWTSSHDDSRQRTIPEESLYLTGDEVAVELTAEVLYRIADVRRFALSGGRQPAETVRKAAESVLRSRVASEILDNVLTEKRSAIEQECAADLQELLASYDLGLDVLAVHWLDVHPPRPVVESFRKVSDAFEQREQAVNEAQAAATRTLYETAGEESIRWLNQQLRKADAQETATDWRLSSVSWAVLSRRNDHGLRMLSGAAGAALLKAEGEAEQQRQQAAGQAARLKAMLAASRGHPGLSQQHLYWTAVVTALESKPFTLIDPQLEGRRQIYLGDSFFRGWERPLNSGPQSPDLPPQADTEKIEH